MKKLLPVVLVLLMLLCSCEALREAGLRAKEDTVETAGSAAVETLPPLPTRTSVPTEKPERTGTEKPGIYGYDYMALTAEEMENLYSYLPIDRDDLEDIGALDSLFIDEYEDECNLHFSFDLKKPYDETEQAVMEYIDGEWEKDDDGANVFIVNPDGAVVSCFLDKGRKDIFFGYLTDHRLPMVSMIIDAHCPPVLQLPQELSAREPDLKTMVIMTDMEDVSITLEWETEPEESALIFEWFRDNLEESSATIYSTSTYDNNVFCEIDEILVDIYCEEDSVSIIISAFE